METTRFASPRAGRARPFAALRLALPAIAFALATVLALGPGAAPAWSSDGARPSRAFRNPIDPWRAWGLQHRPRHLHRKAPTVIVVPRSPVFVAPAPTVVWVPAFWGWNGFGWVWVSGHWAWR